MSKGKKTIDNRRVFINNHDKYCQLFSFSQHKDCSIYCGLPEFPDIIWLSFKSIGDELKLEIVDPLTEDGKLSIHGSGMTAHRSHNDLKGHRLIIKGNYLKANALNRFGARHLFSCYLQEPKHVPENSPAFNRKSDYVLKNSEATKPFTMVFFAIPSKSNLKVKIGASFHVDEVTQIPPEASFGTFSLLYHNVVWFYYRTKHMDYWPEQSRICYYDGFKVPMFIGQSQSSGVAECKLELRHPEYKFDEKENVLTIFLAP